MKNLKNKTKSLSTKKKIYYAGVALMALMGASSIAQAMDNNDLDSNPNPRTSRTLPDHGNISTNAETNPELYHMERAYNRIIESQYSLGQFYLQNGDREKALFFHKMAAKEGYKFSQYVLGDLYNQSDKDEATKYYIMAAEQGHGESQFALGEIFSAKKESKAVGKRWYREASKTGHVEAKKIIEAKARKNHKKGWQYFYDKDEKKQDKQKAFDCFKLAADDGIADAQNEVGKMYLHGDGVSQNFTEAARYFRLAVKQGDADSINRLAHMISCKQTNQEKENEGNDDLWRTSAAQGYFPSIIKVVEIDHLYKPQRKIVKETESFNEKVVHLKSKFSTWYEESKKKLLACQNISDDIPQQLNDLHAGALGLFSLLEKTTPGFMITCLEPIPNKSYASDKKEQSNILDNIFCITNISECNYYSLRKENVKIAKEEIIPLWNSFQKKLQECQESFAEEQTSLEKYETLLLKDLMSKNIKNPLNHPDFKIHKTEKAIYKTEKANFESIVPEINKFFIDASYRNSDFFKTL